MQFAEIDGVTVDGASEEMGGIVGQVVGSMSDACGEVACGEQIPVGGIIDGSVVVDFMDGIDEPVFLMVGHQNICPTVHLVTVDVESVDIGMQVPLLLVERT